MRMQVGRRGQDPNAKPIAALTALVGLSLVATACGGASAAGTPAPATPGATELHAFDELAFVPTKDAWEIVDAFGSIWTSGFVGTMDDGTLSRIDPATNEVVSSVHVSAGTDGIAASDDAIWIMDGEARAIRAVDPATNKLTDRQIAVPDEGGDLYRVGDRIWHMGWDVASSVDTATGTVKPMPKVGGCANSCGIAVGEDAVFKAGSDAVYRLALDGSSIEASNIVDAKGSAIGVGPDAVYVGSPTGGVAILDPKTLELRTVVHADAATTSNGAKWSLGTPDRGMIVGDATGAWIRFSPAVLGRLDAATNTISLYGTLPSEADGASPFLVSGDSLWVTNEGEGSGGADGGKPGVYRLALPTP
jgi:hypothetical protein